MTANGRHRLRRRLFVDDTTAINVSIGLRLLLFSLLLLLLFSATATASEETAASEDEEDAIEEPASATSTCGIWFAPSTIPGAGNGVFAGRSFRKGQVVMPGDLIVAITDFGFHNTKLRAQVGKDGRKEEESKQSEPEVSVEGSAKAEGVVEEVHEDYDDGYYYHEDFYYEDEETDKEQTVNAEEEPEEAVFLWDNYVWDPGAFEGMTLQEAMVADGASFGIGAAPNYHNAFINIYASVSDMDAAGIHRRNSPGAGAFTIYHNRQALAQHDGITAGTELFVDYGEGYFSSSRSLAGVPLSKHYRRGERLLQRFGEFYHRLLIAHTDEEDQDEEEPNIITETATRNNLTRHVFEFMHELKDLWESPVLRTIPDDLQGVHDVLEQGQLYSSIHYFKTIRPEEWLREHGTCMDHLRAGISTIPHAGRGAFVHNRPIAKGETIVPVPLIHLANRSMLDIYQPLVAGMVGEGHDDASFVWPHPYNAYNDVPNVAAGPVHQQLLLNYCFGHFEMDLLLCPYGTGAGLINHAPASSSPPLSSTDNESLTANAKIVWSTKHTLHPEWWDLPPEQWAPNATHAGLAFEIVATRNLDVGTEVLIDYGADWQRAWERHVANWSPPPDSQNYRAAHEWNDDGDAIVPMVTELKPRRTFKLYCHRLFVDWWIPPDENEGSKEEEEEDVYSHVGHWYTPCRAVDRYSSSSSKGNDDNWRQTTNSAAVNQEEQEQERASPPPSPFLYNAEILEQHQNLKQHDEHGQCTETVKGILFGIPKEAFYFADHEYTRDQAQPWSFRHAMQIPDEIVPNVWRTERKQGH